MKKQIHILAVAGAGLTLVLSSCTVYDIHDLGHHGPRHPGLPFPPHGGPGAPPPGAPESEPPGDHSGPVPTPMPPQVWVPTSYDTPINTTVNPNPTPGRDGSGDLINAPGLFDALRDGVRKHPPDTTTRVRPAGRVEGPVRVQADGRVEAPVREPRSSRMRPPSVRVYPSARPSDRETVVAPADQPPRERRSSQGTRPTEVRPATPAAGIVLDQSAISLPGIFSIDR